MIAIRFRPLPIWPHDPTPPAARRSRHTFKAGWDNTLALLDRELRHLDASDPIIGCGLAERDIRQDGWPRADARIPAHPGIEVSFATPRARGGRLVYATDVCEHWQHNVRAIALGLEALRAVDRHGITRRGEQYAGFRALPPGDRGPDPQRGAAIVAEHGSVKAALHATHPDHGGDPRDFADVQAYREAA